MYRKRQQLAPKGAAGKVRQSGREEARSPSGGACGRHSTSVCQTEWAGCDAHRCPGGELRTPPATARGFPRPPPPLCPPPVPPALGGNQPAGSQTYKPPATREEGWHNTLFPAQSLRKAALVSDGSLPEKPQKPPPASSWVSTSRVRAQSRRIAC